MTLRLPAFQSLMPCPRSPFIYFLQYKAFIMHVEKDLYDYANSNAKVNFTLLLFLFVCFKSNVTGAEEIGAGQ